MADEENIRRCVRDELELNLVQRTRNLIRSAAVSTARDLDHNLAGNLLPNRSRSSSPAFRKPSENDAGSSSSGGTKRSSSAPGHSWRFKKSKPPKIQAFQKLFGFWISQARRLRLAPMENLKIILLLMIWSSWKENLTWSVIIKKKTSEENWKEYSAGNVLASPCMTWICEER